MRRVYVGRLGHNVRERDVEKFFRSEGKIREVLMKDGFAFVEFDHSEDAEAAVRHLNGRDINGDRVHVEFAKGPSRGGGIGGREMARDLGRDSHRDIGRGGRGDGGSSGRNGASSLSSSSTNRNIARNDWNDRNDRIDRNDRFDRNDRIDRIDRHDRNDRFDRNRNRGDSFGNGGGARGGGGISYAEKYGPPRNTDYRVIVENLSSRVSWQDLKDLMRQAGEVTFADANKRGRNMGIVDFASLKDMKHAIETFNDTEFHGRRIRMFEDKSRRSSGLGGDGSGNIRDDRSRSRSRGRYSKSKSRSHEREAASKSRSRSRSKSRSKSRSRSRSKSSSKSPANCAQEESSVH